MKTRGRRKLLAASAGVATVVLAGCGGTTTSGNLMPPPPCVDSVRSYYTFACVPECEQGTEFDATRDQCWPVAPADAATDASSTDASDASDGG